LWYPYRSVNLLSVSVAAMNFSTSSSESSCGTPMTYINDKPPFTSHFRKPRVQFLELDSESGGSYRYRRCPSCFIVIIIIIIRPY